MSAKVLNGMQMGCTDGPPAEHYTDEQLSRIHDAVAAIRSVVGVKSEVVNLMFTQLPTALRLEYNYCNWKYVPPTDDVDVIVGNLEILKNAIQR